MSDAGDQPIHATLIAARRAGYWRGALITGRSGAGKSALALRALTAGWVLVADDRVRLWVSSGRLYGAAPARLAGLIEARGIDVIRARRLGFARLSLQVVADEAPVERIPNPSDVQIRGVSLPNFRLPLKDFAAVARLDLALDAAMRRPGML